MYQIEFTPEAIKDALLLRKSDPKAYQKLNRLVEELKAHPMQGTGRPKQLTGNRKGQWSRRITEKHRLVYKIDGEKVIVLILSAYGHYDDK